MAYDMHGAGFFKHRHRERRLIAERQARIAAPRLLLAVTMNLNSADTKLRLQHLSQTIPLPCRAGTRMQQHNRALLRVDDVHVASSKIGVRY